jgi:hypothetical protein
MSQHHTKATRTSGGAIQSTAAQIERLGGTATEPGPALIVHRDAVTGEVETVAIRGQSNHVYLNPAEAGELHRHLTAALGLALANAEVAALVRAFGREAQEASADYRWRTTAAREARDAMKERRSARCWLRWVTARQDLAESKTRLEAIRSAFAKLNRP